MNFGKRATNRKRNALVLPLHNDREKSKCFCSTHSVYFTDCSFTICLCIGVGAFRGLIDSAPDINDVNIMPVGSATFHL